MAPSEEERAQSVALEDFILALGQAQLAAGYPVDDVTTTLNAVARAYDRTDFGIFVLPNAVMVDDPVVGRARVIPEGSAHPDMIRFVEEAKVSGVSAGNPPRALINGRLVRGGALVEPKLGIVFLALDTGRRTLIFRSATGDVVRLEY